ncbi:hypothetical protein HZS_5254 [Henneguya salminicola]|nr:hypothetical protein HZS_5254 [Henneguya salminicola]
MNIDFPLWLVKDLARRKNIISFECPKYYKKTYRDIQDADPRVLNLHKMGPYFYLVGLKFSQINTQDSAIIIESIFRVLRIRLKKILDYSTHSLQIEEKEYLRTLDQTELFLFLISNNQNKKFQDWQYKPMFDVKTSILVEKNKKRKAINIIPA